MGRVGEGDGLVPSEEGEGSKFMGQRERKLAPAGSLDGVPRSSSLRGGPKVTRIRRRGRRCAAGLRGGGFQGAWRIER